MSVALRQQVAVGRYLLRQKLAGRERYPLLVELEPLFQCNLACSFCGKIQYPQHILKQRMPVDQALAAIEECGAPMVSIAGGEPLVHPEVHVMAQELIKRKKVVFVVTRKPAALAVRMADTALSNTPSRHTDASWRSRMPSRCTTQAK